MVTRGGPQPRTVEGGAEALNRSVNGHFMGEMARSFIINVNNGFNRDTFHGIMLITNIYISYVMSDIKTNDQVNFFLLFNGLNEMYGFETYEINLVFVINK